MCGIFAVYKDLNQERAEKAISLLKHRGSSFKKIIESDRILCHFLHPVVNHIEQPLMSQTSALMTNCEIYNWKKLNKKYNFNVKNDAEVLFKLLELKGISSLEELNGVFAVFYQKNDTVYLARDIIGEKPLCYVYNEHVFACASEAKALVQYGEVFHLRPTEIVQYTPSLHKMSIINRSFFTLPVETKKSKKEILKELEKHIVESIKARTDGLESVGILFSGGIDSTLVAFICKKLKKKITCYTAAFQHGNTRDAPDLVQAKIVAKKLKLPLKYIILDLKQTENIIPKVVSIIETKEVVKVGVALPFYCAAELAKKDKQKVLLSGLGSEEIFAGYHRHMKVLQQEKNINAECLEGLGQLWERDLYRDDLVMMAHTLELRLPFLDHTLINYALSIPAKYKINKKQSKIIMRELAIRLGIPKYIAMKKKIAAQYGSNFNRALEKLAKGKKKDYLERI
ncbi:MAG: asparagine synthetase B [Candidatus Woesearchaeota archaeon]|jgi:asparagine synthase (glutamine-hydrolysing)